MKRTISILNAILNDNALTANRIAFVEIVSHLVEKIRKTEQYKEARGALFTEKGEATTELTSAIASENYGYTISATIRKESTRTDWKAYALALGGSEADAKEKGYITTTAGSTAVKVSERDN